MQKIYVGLIGVIHTCGHDPFICTSCTRIMVKESLFKLDMFAQYPLGCVPLLCGPITLIGRMAYFNLSLVSSHLVIFLI